MIRTQISMTEQQAEGLRRLAKLRHRSQADLMREALDQLLAEAWRDTQIDRARSMIGAYRSDGNDADHDALLDEIYAS